MIEADRIRREQEFHDQWARLAQESPPNVRHVNEALTSPELRYIHRRLEDVRGKKVMDLGCGLGEASVYFAMRGAHVTAVDLSPGMLEATRMLARMNGVTLHTHQAAAENIGLPASEKFDIIYAGNLFHHVDIAATLNLLMPYLKSDARMVSWDPLDYNPAINVYRKRATEVRTVDEHPLRRADVALIKAHFEELEVRFFWLFTLVIFVVMALVQRRDPNRVRFWKAVVDESDCWAWLYTPLAALDRAVLAALPFLRWWCWNIVIIAKRPKKKVK